MNDNEIRHAFEKMTETVQPERVENRVRERLAAKEREERKRVRFPRAAVVFACILVLTAVSAGAYEVYRNVMVHLTEEDGPYAYEVQVNLGDDRVTLSADVMEKLKQYDSRQIDMEKYIGSYDIGKIFDTWQDVEEWLGCDLLNSELFGKVLGDAPICLTSNYREEELAFVLLMGTNDLLGMEYSCCNISIDIPISAEIPAIAYGGDSYDVDYSGTDEVIPYSAESGFSADIILTEQTDRYKTLYNAKVYLCHKGIIYKYSLYNPDRDTAVTYMKQILDSLH